MTGDILNNHHSSIIKKGFKTLKKRPHFQIFPFLADLYRQQGQMQIAEKICFQGIKKYPKSCRGYNTLGHTYFDQGKYKKAQKMFEKALDLEPSNLLTLRFLGKIYIQLKDIPQALKIYKMLLVFYPHQKEVQNILTQLKVISTERYQYFSAQPLMKIAHNLDQAEFMQRPRIQPLGKTKRSHTTPTHEVLTQMSQTPLQLKSFSSTVKGRRDKKIDTLKILMDKLSSSPPSLQPPSEPSK